MLVGEVGGDFCLAHLHCPVESESAYSRLVERWEQQACVSMYSSGRAACYAILQHLAAEAHYPLRVLLPSYLCHTMLELVRAAGLEAVFYEIPADLAIDIPDVCGEPYEDATGSRWHLRHVA